MNDILIYLAIYIYNPIYQTVQRGNVYNYH